VRNTRRTRGLAGDGHVRGIAPERSDVLAHPLERSDLVEDTAIGQSVSRREESVGAEAIVDRDRNDAVPRKGISGVRANRARAVHERTAVNPDEHR
jgi:hypothetical protein